MTPPVAGVVLAAFTALLVLAAWQWVRVVVGAFRWAQAVVQARGAPSPDSPPIAGPGSGGHPKGAQRPPTQEGVDGRGGVGYPARHYVGWPKGRCGCAACLAAVRRGEKGVGW